MDLLPKEIVSLILDAMDDPSSAVLVNSTWRDAWFDCKNFWRETHVPNVGACTVLERVRCDVDAMIVDDGVSDPGDIVRVLNACPPYESLDVYSFCDDEVVKVVRESITCLRLTMLDASALLRHRTFDRLETLHLFGIERSLRSADIPPSVKILAVYGSFSATLDEPRPAIERLTLHSDGGQMIVDVSSVPSATYIFVVGSFVDMICGDAAGNSSVLDLYIDATFFDSSRLFDRLPNLVRCSFTDGIIPDVLPASLETLSISIKHAVEQRPFVDWSAFSNLKSATLHNVRCRSIHFPDSICDVVFRRCIVLSASVPYFYLCFRIMWEATIRIDHERRKVFFRDASVIMPIDDIAEEL
jgi:hypothetical protein